MGFEKGHKHGKGRPKGSKNRHDFSVDELARTYDTTVFDILLRVAMGDWQALGFEEKTKTTFTMSGIEVEEENIPLKERVAAADKAARYLYAQKQSVQLSTGDTGIKIIVEDYTKKDPK